MKYFLNIFIITICLLSASDAKAQVFKKLKKSIKDKIESANTKDDDPKFNTTHKIENQDSSKSQSPMDIEAMMGNMMKPAKVEKTYTLEILATMELVQYEDEAERQQIEQGYGDGILWTMMENQEGAIIHDVNNQSIVVLNEERKEAQAIHMDMMKLAQVNDQKKNEGNIDVRKTGKSKMIHGYICEQYIVSHQDGRMVLWFAPDVPFNYKEYLMSFTKIFHHLADEEFPSDKGYVMQMEINDQYGKKTSEMNVIGFTEVDKTINMSDYKLKKMFE